MAPSATDKSTPANIIKDLQIFLSVSPYQSFNLKPDKDGVVSASIPDLSQYNQLFIVGVDSDSVVSRNMEIQKLVN